MDLLDQSADVQQLIIFESYENTSRIWFFVPRPNFIQINVSTIAIARANQQNAPSFLIGFLVTMTTIGCVKLSVIPSSSLFLENTDYATKPTQALLTRRTFDNVEYRNPTVFANKSCYSVSLLEISNQLMFKNFSNCCCIRWVRTWLLPVLKKAVILPNGRICNQPPNDEPIWIEGVQRWYPQTKL